MAGESYFAPVGAALRAVRFRPLMFSALVDLLFLIAYGFFTRPVRDKLAEHAFIIGDLLSQASKQFAQTRQSAPGLLELLVTDPIVRPWVLRSLALLLLLALVAFAVYWFFQGTVWKLARDVAIPRHKQAPSPEFGYVAFMQWFARVNVLWFVLFAAHDVISAVVGLRGVVVERVLRLTPSVVPGIILGTIFVVVLYLAFVSYGLGPGRSTREAFRVAMRPRVLFVGGILFLSAFLADRLLGWLGSFDTALQLVAGIVVLFPLAHVARLSFVYAVDSPEVS